MKSEVNKTNEYLVPVRPGESGKSPFWNGFSKRFMYAPAFEFGEVDDAKVYRFTVRSEDG